MQNTTYDAIIVGGGLSGLIAALTIQKAGYKTAILEQTNRLGGLCGTQIHDDYEFVLACNDFGQGFVQILKELDIDIDFIPIKNLFYFEQTAIQLPPNISTAFRLLTQANNFRKLINGFKEEKHTTLQQVLDGGSFPAHFKDYVNLISYASGASPHDMSLETIKELFSKEYNYGYEKSVIPKGGTQHLANQLVEYFIKRGGEVFNNTTYISHSFQNDIHKIQTLDGTFEAYKVVSSLGRWEDYPENSKPSLSLSMLCLAISPPFKYPKGIHAISYFPRNMEAWLHQLDQGLVADTFGFHFFKSDLDTGNKYQAINVYFFAPRGEDFPTTTRKREMESYILKHIERILPSFQDHILYSKYLSAGEYQQTNQCSSIVSQYLVPTGFQKPSIYKQETDTYYIGNSVYPPGEHAGGAVLSGKLAGTMVAQSLSKKNSVVVAQE